MKVLWLCSWYPHSTDPFDGDFVERHARSLATQQQVDIIHIVQNLALLQNEKSRTEEKEEKNIRTKIYYVPVQHTGLKKAGSLVFNVRYYATLYAALKTYIRENGRPDLVHVHVPVKIGAGAIWLKKRFEIPFVVTEHATVYFKHSHDNYFERGFQNRYITRKTFSEAEALVSVSDCMEKVIDNLFVIKKKYIIRNAVNTGFFFPKPVNNPVRKFVHVSMMVPFKNVEGILKGLVRLNETTRNWQMIFIGPASTEQKNLTEKLGLNQQVVWKGILAYTEVAKEMQQADALVHFSKYENLPCVVNEALCCGLPVISSDVGGIAELINEHNGMLVESENIEQLANAMALFLQQPERFNQQQISAAAAAQFNYETIGKEIVEMYQQVLLRS